MPPSCESRVSNRRRPARKLSVAGRSEGQSSRSDQPVDAPKPEETQVQATEPVVEAPAPEQVVEAQVVETPAPTEAVAATEKPKRAPRKKAEPKADLEPTVDPESDAAEPKDGDA